MKDFLTFLNNSYTAYHAVKNIEEKLNRKGFIKLDDGLIKNLKLGKSYYVVKNSSSIIAFKIPQNLENVGFNIVASHSDSPSYKIKPVATLKDNRNNYIMLNTEGYGGMINYSWMDRPLGIAGRVFKEFDNGIEETLVNFEETITIPSLAIHLNRTGEFKSNPQIDMLPLLGCDKTFEELLEKYSGNNVISYDLFLYNKEEARIIGSSDEYILSSKLDDLECAYASIMAITNANNKNITVASIFNNEEVGSRSNNGADSTFLRDIVEQICNSFGLNIYQALSNSFIVSADNAHAVHPNHPEKTDPTNRVYMNNGIVVKHQAGLSYTTDALSEAVFKKICKMVDVPYQDYTNRSDERGGSTLGAISLSHISISSVDIGLAQLAMHSSMELSGVNDLDMLIKVLQKFYEVQIEGENNNNIIIK